MSSSEKYDVWFSLTVEHEYYKAEHCPIQLHIPPQTAFLFKRHGILWRRVKINKWVFLAMSLDFEDEDISAFCFELIPQDDTLYYVTDILPNGKEGKNYIMKNSSEANKWIEITVPFQQKMEDVLISIESKSKYWEYILINRTRNNSTELKIEEKQKRIEFSRSEMIDDQILGEVFRIKTTDVIKMKEVYDNYAVQLFEIKNIGEQILCNYLPFPRPQEASLSNPNDTITTYFYI